MNPQNSHDTKRSISVAESPERLVVSSTEPRRVPTSCNPMVNGFQQAKSRQDAIYKTLEEGHIRILRLEPDNKVYTSELRGDFLYVSLLQRPVSRYETISYVWGDPMMSASISIDGTRLAIPENTDLALRRVRCQEGVRDVWIDSICINQTDLAEKSRQVAKMCDVYRLGSANLVHLGEDREGLAEGAFSTIQSLHDEAQQDTNDFKSLQASFQSQHYSQCKQRTEIDERTLLGLFSRPWFSRMWVVQEVAFGAKNTCMWGSSEIPLHVILRTVAWLASVKLLHLKPCLKDNKGFNKCFGLWRLETDLNPLRTTDQPSLLILMVRWSDRDASDLRDTVYALVGMTKWAVQGVSIPSLLCPDYTKPFPAVIRDATRCALQEDQSLRTLLYIHHRSEGRIKTEDLCSWAFKGSDPVDNDEDSSVFVSDLYDVRADGQRINEDTFAAVSGDPNILTVNGYVLDVVTSRGAERIHRNDIQGLLFLEGIIEAAQSRHSDADIAMTLTAGTCWRTTGAARWRDSREAASGLSALQACIKDMKNNTTREDWDAGSEAGRFHFSIYHACRNRRLFNTHGGRFGLGPRAVMEGDIVTVLHGAHFPFVLRPIDSGEFQFVGAAYITNCESMEDLTASNTRPLREFRLR